MADNTQILREYLLSLGFQVNTTEAKKFDRTIGGITKSAAGAGVAIVGVATATIAMVQVFTAQMEKLYYASRRTGSTVANLQAIEYGAQAIGISGDQMRGSIEAMARALRTSPGLIGLLKSLGVKVEGRDTSDVMKDMVRAARQLPFYVGSKIAAMFGMDPDTFLMMSQNIDKLDEFSAKRKQMAADAGVDADKAAEAAVAYRNSLNQTLERLGLLKDALAIALLPTMQKATEYADSFLEKLTLAVAKSHSVQEFATRMGWTASAPHVVDHTQTNNGEQQVVGEGGILNSDARATLTRWRDAIVGYGRGGSAVGRASRVGQGRGFINNYGPPGAGTGAGAAPTGNPSSGDIKELFAGLEQQYGLPAGLLDRVWAAESGRGQYMLSPKGAKGHFGFMPRTAEEYGIAGQEGNLGMSADAAAAKYANLMQRYGGDLTKAAAAYNWGEGNFARVGDNLGAAPAETQGYAAKVAGGLTQVNNWNITGTGPEAIAKAVGERLDTSNGNYLNDLKGAGQ